uniref:protein Shroom2 isoform X2 n=1 Tax=Myxine glutinosa TaxID=7769 RepID=UPI00358FCE07
MVDTSPSIGPYGRAAVSARRMLSKVLQNSMRRADIAKRPHSWHFTKFEDCHSDKEEMRISSVPPSSTWHPTYHASSSTTNLSETDCTRPAYTCQTDHYSSCGSMDSFDQLPTFSVKGDEIPAVPRSSSLPYHQHAKTNMSRDKQDSAYSSFSVSDRSDSAENVVSGEMTFLDAITAMPVPISEMNPPNLSCGEGHGHCTFRPVDERQVQCYCESSASHYENVCCSFKGQLNSQETLRNNDCIGGTGKVELQGRKSVSSDLQHRFDSLARDGCHKSGRCSFDYCHLSESEMFERKNEDYNTWTWTQPSLSSAVSVDCLTSSCALLKPPPPPVRSVSFVATRNHDRSPSWSGPEDTIALPQLPIRGTSSCNLVTHSAQPAFELLNPIPWNSRRNPAMQPHHCSFSRSSSQSHHRSASVQGWQCLAPSSFSRHSHSPSLVHSSGSRQDGSFGSSEHAVRVSDSQFKREHEGVWEHKAPEKANSMLELSSHCGKYGEFSPICSHLPPTGPQLPGESVAEKYYKNYPSENENREGLLLTAKKHCTIGSSSSNSSFKGSFDESDFSCHSEKSKFVHTPWKESHPPGKPEENLCRFESEPVHTKQPANPALEPDCHNDASEHALNLPLKLINAENTPMLHKLTQNGVFIPENDIRGGGESRGIRRSDRFATTLRNEIQLKRAQLQRSRSSGQLLPEEDEDEEEKDRTIESNVHGDLNDGWKLHLSDMLNSEAAFGEAYKENVKEAQTKVLRATSFRRRDLEIRLPVGSRSQLIESSAAFALPFDKGCSMPPLHAPRIGGRKRLAEAQKKLSYSEPEKINQVGLVHVTNVLPNLNEKEDMGCTVRDMAMVTNSNEEDGCITAVERRSVADRCRFFEKETNKVGQKHQSLSHNQQQHSFVPITQSTDTILQKGPFEENDTFEIGAVSQKPVHENQQGIVSKHSNLPSAMMAESPVGVSELSKKKVLNIPGGLHDCCVKTNESIVKNVHHTSNTNKNLQNIQMIEPTLEHTKSAWMLGRRRSMDDVLEQGNCFQHVHFKSTPLPEIHNENQSRCTSSRATTCQEGELSTEWNLSRCLDPQQLQRDVDKHAMDQEVVLELSGQPVETQEDNCVEEQEAVLEKNFDIEANILSLREKPQAVLSQCEMTTDAGQLETVNQEKVLVPKPSLPQYSPWSSPETNFHESPCKNSSGDEDGIRVSNDSLIKDFAIEDGLDLNNSTNESFCHLPSPRIGAPLIQTPAPTSFTLAITATTRSETYVEAPQRVKTVPLTIIASNGRVNQMHPMEAAFPRDLMFTAIQEDEPEEAFDESDTNSEADVTINRSQLDVISSKKNDTEDEKNQELIREIGEHQHSLADVLVPATGVFTTCELLERMFSHENSNLDEDIWHRREHGRSTSLDIPHEKVEEELMVSPSSLPACPAYYLVSAAKAELLMKLKGMQPSCPGEEEEMYPDLTEKKAELICSIGRKLQTLREARQSLLQDVHENEQLGANVEVNVCAVCKPNELDKYRMFVGDLDKVVNLLLSLSGRLARVDNALCSLGEDTRLDDRHLLEQKRRVLSAQHQDACELKENLERRRHLVDSILAGLLSPDHLQDYQHFIKMKSALVEEQRELDEKIKLGEEQLRCLRESMPPEYCLTETYNN